MDAIRKTLAGLCAVSFVLTALVALLLFNLERRAFNAATYKQALANQGIYERIPALVGELMIASANYDPCTANPIACQAETRSAEATACYESALGQPAYEDILSSGRKPTEVELQQAQTCLAQFPPAPSEESGPPPFLKNLSASEWQSLIITLLPPAELKNLVDQALDSIFAFLNGRTETAFLDLTNFKRRLTGPPGVKAVLTLLRAQPACTLEQAAAMTLSALSLNGDLELCNPSDELALVIQPLIEFDLKFAALGIPDHVTLIPHTINLAGDTTPMEALRFTRLVMRLSPLIPLLFLLGITIFGVRSLKTWLAWWGWPFLITGVLGLILGLLSAPVLNLLFINFLMRRLPAYIPAGFVGLVSEVTGAVVRQMLKPVVWEGLLLTVIAGIMLFLARRMDGQKGQLAASEAETEIFHD